MRTFGRYRGGGTADAYPARCSICGAVYPRNELRAQNGKLVCNQDWGADAATLDRMNAKLAPGPRKVTRSDGLYRFPEETPIPFVPIDGVMDYSRGGYSTATNDVEDIFEAKLHSWYWVQSASDLVVSNGTAQTWLNRKGNGNLEQGTEALRPVYEPGGFNGRPCLTSTGTQRMTAALTNPIVAGSRPYLLVVGRHNVLDSANDTWVIVSDGSFSQLQFRVTSANVWQAQIGQTGDVSDVISNGAANTNRHLVEVGHRSSTANRLVMDGIGISGTGILPCGRNLTTLSIFTILTTQVPQASIAEIILLNDTPTSQQLTEVRALMASPAARGYGLAL